MIDERERLAADVWRASASWARRADSAAWRACSSATSWARSPFTLPRAAWASALARAAAWRSLLTWSRAALALVSAAVAEAQRQIGKPYQWGAAGPDSFDCSGLTMWAWGHAGVSLPHYTKAQYDATTHISISDLQPGDLVFFGSDFHHMGLYVGGGQMIEAPHTGANVRYASIYRSDLIAASRPG